MTLHYQAHCTLSQTFKLFMIVMATRRCYPFTSTAFSNSNRDHSHKYKDNMRHKVPNLYAIKLNNHAITLLRAGKNEGAEKCLIRALLSCTMKEMPPPADLLVLEKEFYERERQIEYPCKSLEDECIYDCIKGMRVYLEPFYIPIESECVDERIIQKAIYFNLGICYVWIKQYDEAHAHFSKALSLYTTQCHNGHPPHVPTNVMILHNLGYINYLQEEYAESLSNQSEALRILLNSNNDYEHSSYSEHVTTCLNSIGIVTMHTISTDIDLSAEREALRVQHCCMEAMAIQNEATCTSCDDGASRHKRSSLNVRKTLARIKEVGVELLRQEQQCRCKKIQQQYHSIKIQRRITV